MRTESGESPGSPCLHRAEVGNGRKRLDIDTGRHEGPERGRRRPEGVLERKGSVQIRLYPVCHEARKTGSITNQVRNSARLISSMLGGACCRPIAWRSTDSTVTMKGKAGHHDQKRPARC